jgi:hypothetical protein
MIQLEPQGGVYVVPVRVNGTLILPFVIDSGAADVAIPGDVFLTLSRTGTVKPGDFIGRQMYVLADGSQLPSDRFILRELRVGDHVIRNVVAHVANVKGDPLLGQSFLSKLPAWSIDNQRHALVLRDGGPTGEQQQARVEVPIPGASQHAIPAPTTLAPPAIPGPAFAGYGAFALDENAHKFGYSLNQPGQQLADQLALTNCKSANCQIVFPVGPRQCGALATSEEQGSTAWGGAIAPTRDAAGLAATNDCQKHTSDQCKVQANGCNR